MNWYFEAIKKYAVFTGRARRKEFWMFSLLNFIITYAFWVIGSGVATLNLNIHPGRLCVIYILASFIPTIAVEVRRLHDTGRNGWWLLISMIPLLGTIAILVLMAQDSTPGENQYGPNPKNVSP